MFRKLTNTKYKKYIVAVCILTIVLNILGCIQGFCNFYKSRIYGYIATAMGFILSAIPFAVGEILMYVGAIMIVALILILVLLIFLRKKAKYKVFAIKYIKSFVAIIATLALIYTINWVIPFRSAHLDVKPEIDRKYSIEEMEILRDYTVKKINEVAAHIPRDEYGRIILPEDLGQDIPEAMNNVSDEFPLLKGYYPKEKTSLCSSFLTWMGIGGYTYPYTMEVSHNKYIDYMYMPVLLAHEQSHHKGYYQENEATFLSIVACINSDSDYLQYVGYYSLYCYIENDYYRSLLNLYEDDSAKEMFAAKTRIIDVIREDRADALAKRDGLYKKEVSPVLESLFKKQSEKAAEAGWKTQGEIIGEATYSGCVKYLLEYYDGILY